MRQPLSMQRAATYAVVAVSLIVLLVQVAMLVRGAWVIGIGWDEHDLVQLDWVQPFYATRNPIGYGVYGYSTQYLGHALNVLFGQEQWLRSYDVSARAYAIRHEGTAFLGILGLVVAGYAAWTITRTAWVALLAAAILAALPVWSGHAMMNPKDIPVALGYTMVSVGMVAMTTASWSGTSRWRLLSVVILIAVGTFIAAGSRPPMAVPLLLTFLLYAALEFLSRGSWRIALRTSAVALLGITCGTVLILAANSYLLDDLSLELLQAIVGGAKAYPWIGAIRLNGQLVTSTSLPRDYWALVIFLSVPLIIFAFFAIGVALTIMEWLSTMSARGARISKLGAALTILLAQAILLPTVATVLDLVDYDSQRHHLYVFPALAILASIGIWWARTTWLSAPRDGTGTRSLTARSVAWTVVVCLALIVPTVEAYRLFPYTYVYMNPVASLSGVNGRWETDYWGLAMRDAQRMLPAGTSFSMDRASPSTFEVYAPEQGTGTVIPALQPGEDLRVAVPRGDWRVPPNCRVVGRITRPLRGEALDLAMILACTN